MIMTQVQKTVYRNIPFTQHTPLSFIKYLTPTGMLDMCPTDTVVRVFSIGVLYSEHGHYYLKDMPHQSTSGPNHVHVSTEYLTSLPSAYIPYTAQVVGDLDWKGVPILHIQLLKPLHPATAIKLNNAMMTIKNNHLAAAKQAPDVQRH